MDLMETTCKCGKKCSVLFQINTVITPFNDLDEQINKSRSQGILAYLCTACTLTIAADIGYDGFVADVARMVTGELKKGKDIL